MASISVKELVQRVLNTKDSSVERDLLGEVYTTGIEAIDRAIGGFHRDNLVVIGGAAGSHSSMLLMGMARNMAQKGHRVAYYSLRETESTLLARLTQSEWTPEALERLSQLSMSLEGLSATTKCDSACVSTLDRFCEKVRAQHQEGLDVVFLDGISYFQMPSSWRHSYDDWNRMVVSRIKQLAAELHLLMVVYCPVGALYSEDFIREPTIEDLGYTERDRSLADLADWVFLLHRPEYYGVTENVDGVSLAGVAYLYMAKAYLLSNHRVERITLHFQKVCSIKRFIL